MDQNNQNNKNNGGGNNFFNKNPIGAFIIFAVIMIIIFKAMSPEGGGLGSEFMNSGSNVRNVSYSELKNEIQNGSVSMVSIGQTNIKAQSNGTTYIAKKYPIMTL